MRVAHVITRLVIGGAQENTVATVRGLRERHGMDARLISGPGGGTEGLLAEAQQWREARCADNGPLLTIVPELVRPVHPLKDMIALRKLEGIFRETRPDIVHTHSGKAGILGRLAARGAGVPLILHTIHGPSFGNFQNFAANRVFLAAEKFAARCTTHFIAVSEAMKDQYLAAGIGTPEQYTTIFSGFDLGPFLAASDDVQLRKRLGIAPDDFVVGKIARLFPLKGHDDLLAAAPEIVRQNPKIKFLLVGDGRWRARFENFSRSRGLEKNVIFAGLVQPRDVPKYAGIMNALAHLSLREGLPRALPQALAAGKPVVAWDCDGAREVCMDGRTGFLLRRHDLDGLKKRLLQLASDAPLCAELGKAGRALVRENFGVEKMIGAIHDLYTLKRGHPLA
ncbi:MAG: glycosyltransferase family 4 protein [Verrucomicrobiota bacterium]|nr:glycosyltransferase family 4 protein [Verrucomicrobiota bacterium]